ncbi:LacI family transcriptional regulator [Anopheles sinensis]|uniref:LacI family transcriptional regulator n=1 Tax=Anopheles sinensis TaxID=74873 RepID=A0A084VYX0_ANOSI|nr:LacI family transcriptional regulator [Anopheles sinensis]
MPPCPCSAVQLVQPARLEDFTVIFMSVIVCRDFNYLIRPGKLPIESLDGSISGEPHHPTLTEVKRPVEVPVRRLKIILPTAGRQLRSPAAIEVIF